MDKFSREHSSFFALASMMIVLFLVQVFHPAIVSALAETGQAAINGDAAGTPSGNSSSGKRTPRSALSVTPDISYKNQNITEDVTWSGTVLIQGSLIVSPQATLTIEPGTTVLFKPTSGQDAAVLLVQGRIQSLGNPDKPVLFSSTFAEPINGDWQGIVIMASNKRNILENCKITGAETGIEALFSKITLKNIDFTSCGTGARIQDCLAVIYGGGASGCGIGLNFQDAEADVRNVKFSGNRQAIVASQTSLYVTGAIFYGNTQEAVKVEGGRVRIIDNSFSVNGHGITLSQCEGTVSANSILKNLNDGISLVKARVKVIGNDISQNGKVGLKVEDGKGVAWGNTLNANKEFDLYNGGDEDFKAMGNWWGESSVPLANRIFDRQDDARMGKIHYNPVLPMKPKSGF